MSELDDFLDKDREAAEARQKERERREQAARAQAEAERAARGYRPGMGASRPSGPPEEVVSAYRTLGLPLGATLPQIKAAYKKLLMQYHPDRNSDTPEKLRRATEISASINAAYQRLETWTATGA
jgi:DnaJ-class molecular chaperone